MIAIAGLIAQILDDGVGRRFLHDARRVTTVAAQGRLFAAARSAHRRRVPIDHHRRQHPPAPHPPHLFDLFLLGLAQETFDL